jgi:dephospho-CoA kinase
MKTIGLAGRPGSGKSAVARALAMDAGVEWINLDQVAWETYAPGTETFDRVVKRFGDRVIAESGEIDRGELAVLIFLDPAGKDDLEAIVHPAVLERLAELCQDHRSGGLEILLVEGALLASSRHVDWSIFDAVLWLNASDATREARLRGEGRADHASRGDDMSPGDRAIVVDAEGTIREVAERVRERILGS